MRSIGPEEVAEVARPGSRGEGQRHQKGLHRLSNPEFRRSGLGPIPEPDNPHKIIASYAKDIVDPAMDFLAPEMLWYGWLASAALAAFAIGSLRHSS